MMSAKLRSAPFDTIPSYLRQFNQFVLWELRDVGREKPAKIPMQTNGQEAKSNDPATWTSYDAAIQALNLGRGRFTGIGFVFTKDDPLAFLDFDNVIKNGQFDPLVTEALQRVPSWAEFSQSGEGIHIICTGSQGSKITKGLELYTHGRFVALTGRHVPNTSDEIWDCTPGVDWFRQLIIDRGGKGGDGKARKEDALTEAVVRSGLVRFIRDDSSYELNCWHAEEHSDPGDTQGAWYKPAFFNGHEHAAAGCQHTHQLTLRSLEAYLVEHDEEYRQHAVGAVFEVIPDDADVLSLFDEFKITQAEADAIANPEWIWRDLIIQGHICVICAAPGGGKTTLCEWVAGEIAQKAHRKVLYITADASGGDAKLMKQRAVETGYTLLMPDFKVGKSMDDVMAKLTALSQSGRDLSDMLFFVDTLKKAANLMHKTSVKDLFTMLRSLTSLGATVVMLAHTNKYTDNGVPIFEGVGDVRSDTDELIYLVSSKTPDKRLMISTITDPDMNAKTRGDFQNTTYEVDRAKGYGHVKLLTEYHDIINEKAEGKQESKDVLEIEAITDAIQNGCTGVREIKTFCKDRYNVGWRRVDSVLERYTGKHWDMAHDTLHNKHTYSLKGVAAMTGVKKPEPAPMPQGVDTPDWLK